MLRLPIVVNERAARSAEIWQESGITYHLAGIVLNRKRDNNRYSKVAASGETGFGGAAYSLSITPSYIA